MIIEGAIGDAYGAGFEFAEKSFVEAKNTVTQYERHPLFSNIYKRYTDDTQMSLALAELLISGDEWTALNIANKFVEAFKRDAREGYAKRFYALLDEVSSGQELLDRLIAKSERNGAAMRAYPLGVLNNEQDILEKCALQASVTHDTEKAIQSAQAVSLMSHFFLYGKGNRSELINYLSDIQKYDWKGYWTGEVKIEAIPTVEAVLRVLTTENTLKGMLKKSVDFCGDVDTVASLALAIGSLDNTIENNLPQWLFDDLEDGTYGRGYIKELDKKLLGLIKYEKEK